MDQGAITVATQISQLDAGGSDRAGPREKRSADSLGLAEQSGSKRRMTEFPVDFDGEALFLGDTEEGPEAPTRESSSSPPGDGDNDDDDVGDDGGSNENEVDSNGAGDELTEGDDSAPHSSISVSGRGLNAGAPYKQFTSPLPSDPPFPTTPSKWLGHFTDSSNLQSINQASATRAYRQLEGPAGELCSTLGVLLPDGYKLYSDDPDFPWICPLRDCRRLFPKLAALGGHFNKHRRTLVNDNGDGTLSTVGTYAKPIIGENGLPAVVISKIPCDLDLPIAPPLRNNIANTIAGPNATPQSHLTLQSRTSDPPTPLVTSDIIGSGTGDVNGAVNGSDSKAIKAAVMAAIQSSRNGAYGAVIEDLPTPIPGDPQKMWDYIKPWLRTTRHPPKTGYVREVLGLPRLRDIQWNTEWKNGYFESFPRDVTALIMHVVGVRPPAPCARCDHKRGPFHGCLVLPSYAPTTGIVSCSNCWYHGYQTQCSLQRYLRDRAMQPSEVGKWSPSPPAPRDHTNGTGPSKVSIPTPKPAVPSARLSESEERTVAEPSSRTSYALRPDRGLVRATGPPPVVHPQPPHPPPLPASGSMSSVMMTGTPQIPVEALEMEDWEVGPGRMPSRAEPEDNIAFSNAYLSTNHSVAVANGISFRVEIVRPGTSRVFEMERHTTRICSLASGKLKVQMQGEPELTIGPNGMVKIRPGVECTVQNRIYMDCVLHVSTITTEEM